MYSQESSWHVVRQAYNIYNKNASRKRKKTATVTVQFTQPTFHPPYFMYMDHQDFFFLNNRLCKTKFLQGSIEAFSQPDTTSLNKEFILPRGEIFSGVHLNVCVQQICKELQCPNVI